MTIVWQTDLYSDISNHHGTMADVDIGTIQDALEIVRLRQWRGRGSYRSLALIVLNLLG